MSNGFYGNISNVSKTQMQIDKIYKNRKDMDDAAHIDNVAIGRYVLVEYDSVVYPNHYYLNIIDGALCITKDDNKAPKIEVGTIVNIINDYKVPDPYKAESEWKVISHITDSAKTQKPGLYVVKSASDEKVIVERVAESEDNYNANYSRDNEVYGYRRGYDSTVWMKVLKDGVYAYQYVADLNTIIPTITSSVYRPTAGINIPHFDTDSTNTLYNLHVYPMPGFRIRPTKTDTEPSDEQGLSIYFNKAGFDKDTIVKSDVKNHIIMDYTGISGTNYVDGKGVDTHELSIMLPAIGNAISDFWDIVYPKENETTRLTNIDSKNFYNEEQYNLNTLVGCINTTQRILGSITEVDGLPEATEAAYTNGTLYKNTANDKFYIVVKEIIENPSLAAGWEETGKYIFKEVDVTSPLNTIYQMMAQLGQEVYTVDSKIGAYYGKLEEAVKDVKTFRAIATKNADGSSGSVEAEAIGDKLNLISSSLQLKMTAEELLGEDTVTFELQVADGLEDNDKLITSSIVKTELDNVNTLIGDIHTILQSINGTA